MTRPPDFFLTTIGEFDPISEPRACWGKARLRDAVRDDYMLVDIDPPATWRGSPGGDDPVVELLLSTRFRGYTLFPISEWPCYVYVSRILDPNVYTMGSFSAKQIEYVAKGSLHPTYPADVIKKLSTEFIDTFASPNVYVAPNIERQPDVRQLICVREQSGPVEDEFKARITPILEKHRGILRAYLARLRYPPDTEEHVALCVVRESGTDEALVAEVGAVVTSMFNSTQHLDTIFLTPEQEFTVAVGCRAFFNRRSE